MIIREWRGRTHRSKAVEYPEHFRRSVAPGLQRIPGFLGAYLSGRAAGDMIEYVVLTRWTDMASIRAFAGADPDKAVVEPAAIAALTEYDLQVNHYEVIEDTSP
jgi:heme-degrading monooxygenase HmoA